MKSQKRWKIKDSGFTCTCPIEKIGTKTTATNSFGDTKTPRD